MKVKTHLKIHPTISSRCQGICSVRCQSVLNPGPGAHFQPGPLKLKTRTGLLSTTQEFYSVLYTSCNNKEYFLLNAPLSLKAAYQHLIETGPFVPLWAELEKATQPGQSVPYLCWTKQTMGAVDVN